MYSASKRGGEEGKKREKGGGKGGDSRIIVPSLIPLFLSTGVEKRKEMKKRKK